MLRSFNSLLEIVRNYGKIISNNYGAYTHYEWRRDMKKLLLCSLFLVGILGPSVSAAVCDEQELSGLAIKNSDEYLYQSSSRYNGKYAYECGRGHCDGGQVIFMPANHYFKGNLESKQKLYYCAARGDQMWVEWKISDIADCDAQQCRVTDEASQIDGYYIMDDNGGNVGISTGSKAQLLFTDRTNICKCKSIGEAKTACVNSGGTWANGKCSCSSSKNIKLAANGESCECINSNYEPNGVNGCKKKQSVIDDENRRRQEEANQKLKSACEESGGSWANNQCACDNAKNLKVSNNVCVCLDDVNYKRNGDRCDLTDAAALQQKCLSESSVASGAYWDDVNKQCRCTNQQYSWNGSICDMNPAILKCLQITGANWNYTTNQCYCVEVGKVINAEQTACVDANAASSGNGSSASASSEVTITQNRARENISSAVAKIEDIKSGLKLTVWRDEEGNFNTSRLLSDSIAGVVLGTAGGLITSNVVKKNQVENGFEDIQCTVGGQVVAGWGDEFRVGIQ